MNRLSPLIVRRVGPAAAAAAVPAPQAEEFATPFEILSAAAPDDLKLFATGFLGGLVFFGTYLA